jgi:hydroxyacylglutathione hydrolase
MLANGAFATTVEPDNVAIQQRMERETARRARGESTVPGLLVEELLTNPFLRADKQSVAARIGMHQASATDVFAALRYRRDYFKR